MKTDTIKAEPPAKAACAPEEYVQACGWDYTQIEATARRGLSETDAAALTDKAGAALLAYCRRCVAESGGPAKAAHTPGPWTVEAAFNPEMPGVYARICAPSFDELSENTGQKYGVAYVQSTLNDEAEANARLIAAAPELLAVLERLLLAEENRRSAEAEGIRHYDGHLDGPEETGYNANPLLAEVMKARNQARAAIAKAEGRA